MARVQTGVTELGVVGSLAGVISVTESTVKRSLMSHLMSDVICSHGFGLCLASRT